MQVGPTVLSVPFKAIFRLVWGSSRPDYARPTACWCYVVRHSESSVTVPEPIPEGQECEWGEDVPTTTSW